MPVDAIPTIRRALETHLHTMPSLGHDIAWENVGFDPGTAGYIESRLLPAVPDDAMLGSLTYIERGVFQVTLVMLPGKGPGPSERLASLIRRHFTRGKSLVLDGIETIVVTMPYQSAGFPDNGKWRTPVTINWEAQVFT